VKLLRKLARSFYYAIKGVLYAFSSERNMKIHFFLAAVAILLAWFFGVSKMEWLVVFLMIGLVICLEMVNTAIEALVDLVTGEYRYWAAVAKNVAAGAVFFASIIAIVVAIIIFLPYVQAL
jgi:diacylglycerol kinase